MTPRVSWKKPVEFFARREHFIDHMLPVWNALKGERGVFWIPEYLEAYAQAAGVEDYAVLKPEGDDPLKVRPEGLAPLVVSAYGDALIAKKFVPQRPFIMMEHGVGLTFSGHPGYAGGRGLRNSMSLFLAPNEFIRAKTQAAIRDAMQVVIGTPKLDAYGHSPKNERTSFGEGKKGTPVVAISFHWNGEKVAPEAGNALLHYMQVLPELAKRTDIRRLGHGHPKYRFALGPIYESLGIEVEWTFARVMERADVYVNDCSSTMYEFCVTGKPVVILNAPWFRRNVKHGIRFWDYTDIGPQVDEPTELNQAIERVLNDPQEFSEAREAMVRDLYPYLGYGAQRAAGAILGFIGGKHG
jgi:hypothetical protein